MKDPLQTEETPYEVLGVASDATDADVEKAFRAAFKNPAKVERLLTAKRTLQRPMDRALVDLFQYDDSLLDRLNPNPALDRDSLVGPRRLRTADGWRSHLKSRFPDPTTAHCLAVLWYWSAIFEEQQLAAGTRNGGPPVEDVWPRTIGYWSMLLNSADFWESQTRIQVTDRATVRAQVLDRLRARLHGIGQRHQGAGDASRARRYQDLDLALSAELRTGEELAATGFKTNRGKIACGRLLLEELGLLDSVRHQVTTALQRAPSNQKLVALRDRLSCYSAIVSLIEHNRPAAALEALDSLPIGERNAADGLKLRAKALHEEGREHSTLGNIDLALQCWKSALNCGGSAAIENEIKAAIVAACHSRATSLGPQRRDEAILVLEAGLDLAHDRKLQMTLAELLTQRGIDKINDAQQAATRGETGLTPELIAAIEEGAEDLERAAELGSRRAADQVEVARELVETVRNRPAPLPPAVLALVGQANAAAAVSDWPKAVRCLREAIKLGGAKTPDVIRQNLAMALANQAISEGNSAVEQLTSGQIGFDTALSRLQSAQNNLSEASRLDPSSDYVRKNLAEVNDVIKSILNASLNRLSSGVQPTRQQQRHQQPGVLKQFGTVLSNNPSAIYLVGAVLYGIYWLVTYLYALVTK